MTDVTVGPGDTVAVEPSATPSITVSAPGQSVTIDDADGTVLLVDTPETVVVTAASSEPLLLDGTDIEVVSIGEQGPAGPQGATGPVGPMGPPGGGAGSGPAGTAVLDTRTAINLAAGDSVDMDSTPVMVGAVG